MRAAFASIIATAVLMATVATQAHAEESSPPAPPSDAAPASEPGPPLESAAPTAEATPSSSPPAAPAPAAEPPPPQAPQAAPAPVPAYAFPDAHEAEPEQPPSRWYGWQTLIADGTVLAFLVAGASSDTEEQAGFFAYSALAGYVVAGPVIHFTHGNPGRGFGSLGLRVGLPIVVGVAANEMTDCQGDFCGLSGVVFGALGALGAMAIDAALLAYEPADDSALRLAPVVGLNSELTYLGAKGSF